MKIIYVILMSTFIVACSKGNNTKARQFVVTPDMIQAEFEKEMAKHTIEKCEYAPRELVESKGFFGRIKARFAKKKIKKDFDIKYSQELTDQVMYELKEYAIEKRSFEPRDFWRALTRKTKRKINRYLIGEFAKFEDKDFLKIRELVAYSFLFYFQEKDRKLGYEFQINDPEIVVPTIRVAYSEAAVYENREQLNLCDSMTPGVIVFSEQSPENKEVYLLPSDITSYIVCENKRRAQKIELRVLNNEIMELYVQQAIDQVVEYNLPLGDLEVNTSNRGTTINFSTGREKVELRVSKKRETKSGFHSKVASRWKYRDNSISGLSFTKIDEAGEKTKTKRLRCEVHKEFLYEDLVHTEETMRVRR